MTDSELTKVISSFETVLFLLEGVAPSAAFADKLEALRAELDARRARQHARFEALKVLYS